MKILIEYLDDMRGVLAEFAHTTLIRITDHDFGKNKHKWTAYVNSIADSFEPIGLFKRIEGKKTCFAGKFVRTSGMDRKHLTLLISGQ